MGKEDNKGDDNMTVFAVPIENNDLVDAKTLHDFIVQGKKESSERKKEMNERMKKISKFIEIREN